MSGQGNVVEVMEKRLEAVLTSPPALAQQLVQSLNDVMAVELSLEHHNYAISRLEEAGIGCHPLRRTRELILKRRKP